jgi:glyceraldehyde-3-phosphate dehydrogenase/erythrose-4-phosphate dehydrogenase
MKSKAFRYAAQHNLKSILDYTEDPIVSVDIMEIKTHAYLTHN